MQFCTQCGARLEDTARFCNVCGQSIPGAPAGASPAPGPGSDSFMDKLTGSISSISGGTGAVRPPLGEIFGQIFHSHTREESEDIFLCSSRTTPEKTDSTWPHPWLFSRVLAAFAVCFLMLYICVKSFNNAISLPGLILMGAFAMPISLMFFFFEMNAQRNISIYTMLKTFFVGGCASLLLTLLLFELIGYDGELDFSGAIIVGIVEEVAKMGLVWFFLRREKCTTRMHGLVIGAAIGAGFAAFESAGYASVYGIDNIFLRALLAPGGHVAWAAIEGYALMLAKDAHPLPFAAFGKGAYWKLTWIPIALHATWDMPIELGQEIYLVPILLTVAAWIVLFVLIHNALVQLGRLSAEPAAPAYAAPAYAAPAYTPPTYSAPVAYAPPPAAPTAPEPAPGFRSSPDLE